jgi:pyrimidine operon attenuation protein/uracil phosphoribosyltransferase
MKTIMDMKEIERALTRMAHEIIEDNRGCKNIALIGIRTGGVPLAERLCQKMAAIEGIRPNTGILDITLYRDDWSRLSQHPLVKKTEIDFPLDDKTVVLVDDVIYTGRTIRAALDAITDLGRPRRIQLAVLVDRGRRELPIQPDYVGLVVATAKDEYVNVFLNELDGRDEVVLGHKTPKSSSEPHSQTGD